MGKAGRKAVALALGGLALTAGLAACGDGSGYAQAYVVGEVYCPGDIFATCVLMSDGDIVGPVGNGILDDILAGMVLSPYSGGYRFTRQSSVTNVTYRRITVVQSATAYAGRRPVTPSAEVSDEKSGDTYSAGGRSYPKSPTYQKRQAAAVASRAAAARYAKQQQEQQDDVPPGYGKKSSGSRASLKTGYRAAVSRSGK